MAVAGKALRSQRPGAGNGLRAWRRWVGGHEENHEGHARQCATGDSTWPLAAGLRIGAFLFQTFKPANLGFAGLHHQTARMRNRNRNRNRNFNRNRFTDIA